MFLSCGEERRKYVVGDADEQFNYWCVFCVTIGEIPHLIFCGLVEKAKRSIAGINKINGADPRYFV